MLTRSSVHWADSIVAINSSSGLLWFKLHFASGYAFLSRAMIFRVRSFSSLLANH